MADRPLVAVLTPVPTDPLTFGNRKRIWNVCAGLKARGFDISLILYALDDEWRLNYPQEAGERMRQDWGDVHVVLPSVRYHAAAADGDHTIDEWWDPVLETFLKWYFAAVRPSGFIVNYPFLSKALEFAPPTCLKILDTHDRFSDRREMLAALGVKPEFFHTTAEQEAIALARADLNLAINDAEREAFAAITDRPVITLPYVEQSRPRQAPPSADGYLRLGLLGAANNVNRVNVSRFLDVALPRFRDFMAPIKVVLAGGMCRDLENFSQSPDVELLGPVDGVGAFYDAVDVVAAPIETATGQPIKVGEALAHGLPVVAHARAFEGYPRTHPNHALESMEDMARACIQLAFEPEELTSLVAASVLSQARQRERVDDVLDGISERIRKGSKTLFVVDAAKLAEPPTLAVHVLTMVRRCAEDRRVTVLIRGQTTPQARQFVRQVGKFADVKFERAEDASTSDAFGRPGRLADMLSVAENDLEIWSYDRSALPLLADSGRALTAIHGFCEGLGFSAFPAFDCGVRSYLSTGTISPTTDPERFTLTGWDATPIRPYANDIAAPFLSPQAGEGAHVAVLFAGDRISPLLLIALCVVRSLGRRTTVVAWDGLDLPALREALGLPHRGDPGFTVISLDAAAALGWRRCTHFLDLAAQRSEHLATLEWLRLIAVRRGRSDLVWCGPPGDAAPLTEVIADLMDYLAGRHRWAFEPLLTRRVSEDGMAAAWSIRDRGRIALQHGGAQGSSRTNQSSS